MDDLIQFSCSKGIRNSLKNSITKEETYKFHAMGGPCEISLCISDPLLKQACYEKCEQEVKRLEQKYSRYRDDNIVYQINNVQQNPVIVDAETAGLLNYANIAFEQSDGLFDITSGVLRRIWDFKSGTLPSADQIKDTLKLIGWDKVHWDGKHLVLPEKMEIDFGGLVKEYAADAAANIARSMGCFNGYINLGGDISVIGPKLVDDKSEPWVFGIRNPNNPETAAAQIAINQGGLASSGDYERYFVLEGKRYCHVLNPKTGYPCEGVAGVSVLSENCLTAGTMSTIAMLKGAKEGENWLVENQLEYLMIKR